MLVRVNWNAWLYGDKPSILKFLLYSPVAQPLNPTSNNNSQNGEKLYHTLFMAATNHVANSLWQLMGKLKSKIGYFNIFFKNLFHLSEK